ncbi:MAG: pectate lyase [Verrucomicrobiales bacterium]|nr:pectate lyase [Verrucomicrobiales bacterium]
MSKDPTLLSRRLNPVWQTILLSLFLGGGALFGEEVPDRELVVEAMKEATEFYRENLSVEGGYASSWDIDLSKGYTEHRSSPTLISIQPHGTTTVGLRMLRAYEVTGEEVFLEGARDAAESLAVCQLSSGGWEKDFDFDPDFVEARHTRRNLEGGDASPGKRRHMSTLDDFKTTSALWLLLEYVHAAGADSSPEVTRALTFGVESLLAAQFPNGGWPQGFEGPADPSLPVLKASFPDEWPRKWPQVKYTGYATLNDGNLGHVMDFLLRAHELTGESRYLEAALRLGDFLLLAQFEGEQSAWAQQYDESMHPVWARKFEPPAISSSESLSAAETLVSLWKATGEARFRESVLKGLSWLEKSQLSDGQWARFYELKTNRPLYCEADTYELTYDDSNLPTHYGFKIQSSIERKIVRLRETLEMSPAEARAKASPPKWPESWKKRARGMRKEVREALDTRSDDGYWLNGDKIDAGLFVRNMATLSDYVEALDKSIE